MSYISFFVFNTINNQFYLKLFLTLFPWRTPPSNRRSCGFGSEIWQIPFRQNPFRRPVFRVRSNLRFDPAESVPPSRAVDLCRQRSKSNHCFGQKPEIKQTCLQNIQFLMTTKLCLKGLKILSDFIWLNNKKRIYWTLS